MVLLRPVPFMGTERFARAWHRLGADYAAPRMRSTAGTPDIDRGLLPKGFAHGSSVRMHPNPADAAQNQQIPTFENPDIARH